MKVTSRAALFAVAMAALVTVGCADGQAGSGGSGGSGGASGVCPQSSYCIDGVEMAPTLGVRSASVLTVDGRDFKDSNGNGELDPYEDWRLSPADRAADLVSKMELNQQIGLLSETGWVGPTDESGDLNQAQIDHLTDDHVRQGLIRWPGGLSATAIARHMNNLQELAESLPLGIPVLITTDPIFGVSSDMSSSMLTREADR
jgi:hypothetical protein